MSVNREYKNSLFSLVFNEPDKMLEIYNAISGNVLPPETPVEPTTLEEALFMDRINDLAFVVDGRLVVLIEQQSTLNRNMPLRLLIYMARIYEKLLDNKSVYRSSLVKIPKPEFYVLYIGESDYVDSETLRLSEAFMDNPNVPGFPSFLELEVPVININKGRNLDIIQKSSNLNGYVSFVAKVRELKKSSRDLAEAVTEAVKYCMDNDILADTLSKISSEVFNVLTVEFNLEDAKKVWWEEALEEGIEKGIEQEREQGKRKMLEMVDNLLKLGVDMDRIVQASGLSEEEIRRRQSRRCELCLRR